MKRLLLVAGSLAALAAFLGQTASAQDASLAVAAGVGTGTVSGNVYAPGDISIHAGDSVTWTIASDEPHTITFGTGPADVPPPFWEPTFEVPPGPPAPVELEGSYDGTGFVNTGVVESGSTLTLTFESEGSFPYICAIHPGMSGTVEVVPEDEPATTQEEADAAVAATTDEILGPEEDLRADTIEALSSEERDDGTTLWTLSTGALNEAGPVVGGGTGYLELLEFLPPDLSISAGDTVRWQFPSPHSVTFLEEGQDPFTLGDPFEVEAARPSDEYDGESFYNSGILGLAPNAEYELTFPDGGTYPYICLLHFPLGQTGTIEVAPAEADGLPDTGGGGSVISGDDGALLWLIAAAGVGGATLLAGGWMLRRRVSR